MSFLLPGNPKKASAILYQCFQLFQKLLKQKRELKIPYSLLANGVLSIIGECSAVMKPFLEETTSRRKACRCTARSKHHKYRPIINYLLLFIHVITLNV